MHFSVAPFGDGKFISPSNEGVTGPDPTVQGGPVKHTDYEQCTGTLYPAEAWSDGEARVVWDKMPPDLEPNPTIMKPPAKEDRRRIRTLDSLRTLTDLILMVGNWGRHWQNYMWATSGFAYFVRQLMQSGCVVVPVGVVIIFCVQRSWVACLMPMRSYVVYIWHTSPTNIGGVIWSCCMYCKWLLRGIFLSCTHIQIA